jgi:hypothetical protein
MTKRDRKNICVLLIAKHLINKSKIKVDFKVIFSSNVASGWGFSRKITLATHASSLVNYRKIIKLCRWFVAMPVKCPNILRFPLKKHNSRFTMVVMCTWYKVPNLRKLLFNLSYKVWLCKLVKVYLFRKLFLLKSWIDVPDFLL